MQQRVVVALRLVAALASTGRNDVLPIFSALP